MKIEIDIINLCPHDVEYLKPDGKRLSFPSKGSARVLPQQYTELSLGELRFINYSDNPIVEGLPDPMDGRLFIVSTMVQQALRHVRSDLISPCMIEKDSQGNVQSCRAFKL